MSTGVTRPLNPRRIGVMAMHTFTQLVRMKVFYFLGIFGLILIGVQMLRLPTHHGPESQGLDLLFSIKSAAISGMTIFAYVIAVVATGILLPKDVEERTLYTILAKPVPRLDYLLGKLFGVCLLIFVSLLIMDLLMTGVITYRTNELIANRIAYAEVMGHSKQHLESDLTELKILGPTWNLQGAIWVIFLRSVVIASVALLLSTFSTSTLFTAIVGFIVVFLGIFQADAREFYFNANSLLGRLGSGAMSVVLPDLQLYNVTDAIIQGRVIQFTGLLKLTGITAFYFLLYTFCSWLVFARKEF